MFHYSPSDVKKHVFLGDLTAVVVLINHSRMHRCRVFILYKFGQLGHITSTPGLFWLFFYFLFFFLRMYHPLSLLSASSLSKFNYMGRLLKRSTERQKWPCRNPKQPLRGAKWLQVTWINEKETQDNCERYKILQGDVKAALKRCKITWNCCKMTLESVPQTGSFSLFLGDSVSYLFIALQGQIGMRKNMY